MHENCLLLSRMPNLAYEPSASDLGNRIVKKMTGSYTRKNVKLWLDGHPCLRVVQSPPTPFERSADYSGLEGCVVRNLPG